MPEENEVQEVIEQPAEEVEVVEQTPEVEETPQQPETVDQAAARRRSAQERINEITRAKHEAEREAAYWRGIAEGKQPPQQRPQAQQPQDQQMPKIADYQDYESYIADLTDWKARAAVQEFQRTQQEAQSRSEAERTALEIAQSWAGRQQAARANISDYDEVLGNSSTTISPSVTDAILTSERGPEIAYHLAKSPELVGRLNRLSPLAAAREIGKIEAALDAPRTVSGAKNPPPPATTSRPSTTSIRDLGSATMEQYIAARTKQGASWAR